MQGCVSALLVDSLFGHAHEATDWHTDEDSDDQAAQDRPEFPNTVHSFDFCSLCVFVDTESIRIVVVIERVWLKGITVRFVDASCVLILLDFVMVTATGAIVPLVDSFRNSPIVCTFVFKLYLTT